MALRGNLLALVKTVLGRIRGKLDPALKAGLERGRDFLVREIKQTVGTPAGPQQRASGGKFAKGFRAVTPATVGAPPRKVSGRLQAGIYGTVVGRSIRIYSPVKSKKGFPYGVYHDAKLAGRPGSGQHPYVGVTLQRVKTRLLQIIGGGFVAELRSR